MGPGTSSSAIMAMTNIPVKKLVGPENYGEWKFAMKVLLQLDGLWPVVEGTEKDVDKYRH